MENELTFVSVVIPTYNRKEKLVRLINSILESNYPKDKLEITVVDDASTDWTCEEVKKKFPRDIRVIRNDRNLLVAGSRNVGIKNSKGEYIFLIDDDNVIDKNCIFTLVETLRKNQKVGIVGPIMYYFKDPHRIWCVGIKRNMITSLTNVIGRDKIDEGQYKELIDSNDFPNAFMIKREIIEKVGLFDDKTFPIMYEEADFGERVRRAGYKIVCNPEAKVWHDMTFAEESKARLFHVHSKQKAYYTARNRIFFHKKHSKWWQFVFFITLFHWLFTIYYLKIIIFDSEKPIRERLRIMKRYLNGIFEGLKWAL